MHGINKLIDFQTRDRLNSEKVDSIVLDVLGCNATVVILRLDVND